MTESADNRDHGNGRVLVVDDDTDFCEVMKRALGRRGYDAEIAVDSASALVKMESFKPDFIVLDLRLGEESGIRLIGPIKSIKPEASIVVLTGFGNIASAVEAIKGGAIDYLTKPVDMDQLVRVFNGEPGGVEVLPQVDPISLRRLEWEHIHRVLAENHGNISATARRLGMHRRTLQRKLQKYPVKK